MDGIRWILRGKKAMLRWFLGRILWRNPGGGWNEITLETKQKHQEYLVGGFNPSEKY